MLGYDTDNLDDMLQKFLRLEIQHGFYTRGFYTYDPEKTKFRRVYENLIVRNKNGLDKVEFRTIFRGEEMWYENNCLYKETYASFVDFIYCSNEEMA